MHIPVGYSYLYLYGPYISVHSDTKYLVLYYWYTLINTAALAHGCGGALLSFRAGGRREAPEGARALAAKARERTSEAS